MRFLVLTSVFALISCSQENITSEFQSISEQLNPTQIFKVSPNTYTLVEGKLGTKILIDANSFVFENEESVTSSVRLSLKEIYTFSEMIMNGLSTTSGADLLQTSGMINLKASSDGKVVKLKSGSSIKISFKKMSDAPFMRTYLGIEDSTKIDWQLDTDNIYDTIRFTQYEKFTNTLSYGVDSDSTGDFLVTYGIVGLDTIELDKEIQYPYLEYDSTYEVGIFPYYEIRSTKLNWINCDYFRESEFNKISVSVNSFDQGNARTFLIFKEYKSIMSPWEFLDGESVFINIPKESEVTIFSVYKNDDVYFLAIEDKILIDNNESIQLKYKKSNMKEIQEQLQYLD
ncbi:MAG: hypothetical protein JXR03_09380 [Cyclobacteriaceae bacterium]